MRLFLAIELPEPIRGHLADLCGGLRSYPLSIVPPQNLHVTLKFLGEVQEGAVTALSEALREAWHRAPEADAARVRPDRVELLPPRGPVRVVAIGLGGDEGRLRQLHHAVEEACEGRGFARDSRQYLPHITLARARDPNPGNERGDLARDVSKRLPAPLFEVSGFTLFESKLGGGPPKYIPLARFGA